MDAFLKELNDHEIKKSKLEKFVDTVTEGQKHLLGETNQSISVLSHNESSIMNLSSNMMFSGFKSL